MKINKEDPIIMSITSLSCCFILFVALLYIFSPACVVVVNPITGKMMYSWKLILTYSLTLSFVVSICVMLSTTKKRKAEKITNYEIPNTFPSPMSALAYL
jgi:hypothetical protein